MQRSRHTNRLLAQCPTRRTVTAMEPLTVAVLADADQYHLLAATLVRVNLVANAVRAELLGGAQGTLRELVKAAGTRHELPACLVTPVVTHVARAIGHDGPRPRRFGRHQSLYLALGIHRWNSDGRVSLPTVKGRRTFGVHVDMAHGGLRPVLEGHGILVRLRADGFVLVAHPDGL